MWNKKILVAFMGLCLISCASFHRINKNTDTPSKKEVPGKEEVLGKALDWIAQHPASFEDGGFLEMGEEANLYYILYLKAASEEEKKIYYDRLVQITRTLLDQKNFRLQFAGEVTAYLAIAKAAERLGFKTDNFHEFIKNQILNNNMTYPSNITYVVLNSSLLKDLGYEPKVPLETSIGQGVIATMSKDKERVLIPIGKNYVSDQDISNFFYDITHEIFAISSFGDKNPEQLLLTSEIEFVHNIIEEGISIYLPKKDLDILCELVVCAKIMNHTNFVGFNEAVDFIIKAQHNDGTFGLIPRMKDLGRGNFYRHGVLVAVWALAS